MPNMEGTDDRRSSAFERHLQTGLAVLVIGLMGWVGITTSDTSRISAVTSARLDLMAEATAIRMDLMAEALTDLKKQVRLSSKNRYTRQDAQRDYTQNLRRFETIEKRITKLESKK